MSYNAFAARNRLVEKGLTAAQAEALLEVIQEHNESSGQGLATRGDLADFKVEILGKLYAALAAQTLATVALIVTLIKVLH